MNPVWVALALVLGQEVPPPVRVPGHVVTRPAERAPERTTLFDGFDAYERLVDAFAAADDATRVDARVHARADGALDDWRRGERRSAVEAWIRLALELEGSTDDLDLLAAAMRLECVEEGDVTRMRRGFYASGEPACTTQLRVRALFPLPELAARSFASEVAMVTCVELLFDEEDLQGEPCAQLSIAFDASGRCAPIVVDVPVAVDAPVRLEETCRCDVILKVSGRTLDKVRIEHIAALAFGSQFPAAMPVSQVVESLGPIEGRAACRAGASRIMLYGEAANIERSCEFLFNTGGLVGALGRDPRWQARVDSDTKVLLVREGEALSDGRSPYADRTWTTAMGPYWRTHAHGKRDIAAWTLVPEAGGDRALPIIVVLHEVGFDEGWAVRLAGGGALFEEADRRGFAVLAPTNADLEADPSAFAALIDSLAADVAIDRARVHILAPASAAPLARRLAEAHPTLVASVIVLGEASGPDGAPLAGVGQVLGLERAIARALDDVEAAARK